MRAPGRQNDRQMDFADTRPSAAARSPGAHAKSPLGASQRPCRESSYELNMWKKKLAFMQRSLWMWQQRAESPCKDTLGDGSSASARVSPLPKQKSPEQDFADVLTRQRALHRHSMVLQPPRLETPRKRPDDLHTVSVDLACCFGLGAGLVALGLHLAGFAFAACVAMVLAVSVLAVLCAVLCTVSLEPEEDSLGVCCY